MVRHQCWLRSSPNVITKAEPTTVKHCAASKRTALVILWAIVRCWQRFAMCCASSVAPESSHEMGVSQENDIWVRAGVQVAEIRVSLVVGENEKHHHASANLLRYVTTRRRRRETTLLRGWSSSSLSSLSHKISCDQTKTMQFRPLDFMKLLKPAVSNKKERRTRCTHRRNTYIHADTRHW